jgi:hypothetical protein
VGWKEPLVLDKNISWIADNQRITDVKFYKDFLGSMSSNFFHELSEKCVF